MDARAAATLEGDRFPEVALWEKNRLRLAWEWIPAGARRLLDAGCGHGHGTRLFAQRCPTCFGVDANRDSVGVARRRYPALHFLLADLAALPFPDRSFEVVVMNDVLEHLPREEPALGEAFRVLAPGGTLILTVPHRGLFSFLDPDDFAHRMRTAVPLVGRLARRAARRRACGPWSYAVAPGYDRPHRHYDLGEVLALLDRSPARPRYRLEEVRRTGLVLGPLTRHARALAEVALGRPVRRGTLRLWQRLVALEERLPFGAWSYHLALRLTARG